MKEEVNEPSVCLYPLNRDFENLEATVSKHFHTLTAKALQDVQSLLKRHHIFCVVIAENIREEEEILEISKVCSAFPSIPCILYGHYSDEKIAFMPGQAGLADIVPNPHFKQLIPILQRLHKSATFRIDLCEFGIDLDKCSFWTRRFIKFAIEDYHFLRFQSISVIANRLGTSVRTLNRHFRDQRCPSPKGLLSCLRNYYAAFLLNNTMWSATEIARRCQFAHESQFYKSFKNRCGLTPRQFRLSESWQDFPSLHLKTITV